MATQSERSADLVVLRPMAQRRHNLPASPGTLVGREHDLAAARALLVRAEGRLLTLTGAGGSGKTRLALQLAADVLDEFPDGVWLVPLAAITDPYLVVGAVAQALGVRD